MESFYDREEGVAWGPITTEEMLDDIMRHRSETIEHRRTLNFLPSYSDKSERFDEITRTEKDAQKPVLNFFPDENKYHEAITISSDEEELQEQHLLENLKITSPIPANILIEKYSSHENLIEGINIMSPGPVQQFNESELPDENYILDKEEENSMDYHGMPIISPRLLKHHMKHDFLTSHENIFKDEPAHSDLENRLPTPANLDDDTYDEICKDMGDNEDNERQNSKVEVAQTTAKHSSEIDFPCNSDNLSEGEREIDYPETPAHHSSEIDFPCSKDSEDESERDYSGVVEISAVTISSRDSTPKHNFSTEGNDSEANQLGVLNLSQDYRFNDQDVFNDTLEEMERLLNQGVNYSMRAENDKSEKKDLPASENIFKSPIVGQDKLKALLSDTKLNTASKASPILNRGTLTKKPLKPKIPAIPISARVNNKPPPKSTLTPTNNNKMLLPNPTPTSIKRRFKNIESPISVYIKNSGSTPLYKKVTPAKPLSCDRIKSISDNGNKENSVVFPEVIYKPAKKTIVSKDAEMKLPKKIASLIPQKASVIKHQGRIYGETKKGNSISRKLLEGDLTINSNISLNTTEDISIRFNKNVYIS